MPVSSILSSVAFTVCIFFYLYIIGSFFRMSVYPLINRVIVYAVFQEYIINGHIDSIIVILATTSWFMVSFNSNAIRYYFSVAYGATGIILALISPDSIAFDIITLLSLPLIISVTLYYFGKGQKSVLNFNVKLTLRYISLAVIAISAIGIVLMALGFFCSECWFFWRRRARRTSCTDKPWHRTP